uniref:Nas2_N domain-containing protein n=1 Tax=Rhabditophanes sp. KR3021 TaxID=114890 RepID=A0AC35UE17_9BILA
MSDIRQNKVFELHKKRDQIDERLKELSKILVDNGVTLSSPLIDNEGYPLAHIDHYTVTATRKEYNTLAFDRKLLEKEIENDLGSIYQNKPKEDEPMEGELVFRTSNVPFVSIGKVTEDSPAEKGGLFMGDQIIQFGKFHKGNFESLEKLKEYICESVDNQIRITVVRNDRPVRLAVTPQKWNGPGLFGALVLIISE